MPWDCTGSKAVPINGLAGAAFFFAAAIHFVMWFRLTERMRSWLQVGWIY
jgi:HAMP domain-containing protein